MYKYFDENKKHLHTLHEKPLIGTSSVMSVIAKPLTWWASGLACETFGWTKAKVQIDGKYKTIPLEKRIEKAQPVFEKIKQMDIEEYLGLCDTAYKAHSVKLDTSAQGGTDMHEELENYVKECIETANGMPIVLNGQEHEAVRIFANWAIENVKMFLWSEAHCYSEKYWIGGISDCGVELKDGRVGIIDFKSAKEAYNTHFWQCAGYALQIEENGLFDKDGNKLSDIMRPIDFYAVLPFGAKKPEPVFDFNVSQAKEAFISALSLYKIINNTEIDK